MSALSEDVSVDLPVLTALSKETSAIDEHDSNSEFSLKKLSHELATATAREEQRRLIDETKKKAIVVAHSYEDFKNRVACANMKPLKSKELKELGNHQTHNRAFGFNPVHNVEEQVAQTVFDRAARARGELTEGEKLGKAALENIKSKSIPKNVSELDRDWKREVNDNKRYILLKHIGLKSLKNIFKKDVPFDLLSDITRVLSLQLLFADDQNEDEGNNSDGDKKNKAKNSKFVGKLLVAMTKVCNFQMYMFALTDHEYDIIAGMVKQFKEDPNHGGLKQEIFDKLVGKYSK